MRRAFSEKPGGGASGSRPMPGTLATTMPSLRALSPQQSALLDGGGGAGTSVGVGVGGGVGGGVGAGAASEDELDPLVALEVTKVERAGKRFATYMTYVIVGTIHSSSGGGGERAVEAHRRYTDFQALRKQICKQYPALHEVLPPLPEKKVLGKFKASFLEKRREGLQLFLAAVVTQQPSYRFLPRFLHRFMTAEAPS